MREEFNQISDDLRCVPVRRPLEGIHLLCGGALHRLPFRLEANDGDKARGRFELYGLCRNLGALRFDRKIRTALVAI